MPGYGARQWHTKPSPGGDRLPPQSARQFGEGEQFVKGWDGDQAVLDFQFSLTIRTDCQCMIGVGKPKRTLGAGQNGIVTMVAVAPSACQVYLGGIHLNPLQLR